MNKNALFERSHKDVWFTMHPTHLGIEIVRHSVNPEDNYYRYGIWNYYIYIYEALCPEVFEEKCWLPPIMKEWLSGKSYVKYNYQETWFQEVKWQRELNYYRKHGEVKGHRSVCLGCDYNHLWDEEYKSSYNQHYILSEAMITANSIAEYLKLPILEEENQNAK